MVRTAFEARTDTVSMWAILQKSCLLVQQDEERERKAGQESLLARRLREARAAEQQAAETPVEADETAGPSEPADSLIIPADQLITAEPVMADDEPAAAELEIGVGAEMPTGLIAESLISDESSLYQLVLTDSGRRISLPASGALVLGRFDPGLTDPLDVDLSYEDRDSLAVSRRHARISGADGHYLIEDLESSNGVFINGQKISPGRPIPLEAGDRLGLGTLRLRFEQISTSAFLHSLTGDSSQARPYLLVTHTGRRITMPALDELIIGRADPDSGFVPDLDLAGEGEVAIRVSRRHARITWRNHQPYLKDLSSTFGTRLGGKRLLPDQLVRLKPGDHLSLGGCVLAYDIET